MRRFEAAEIEEEESASTQAMSPTERALSVEIRALKVRLEEAENKAALGQKWHQEAVALDERIRAMRTSASWKVTRPIRATEHLFCRACNSTRLNLQSAARFLNRAALYAQWAAATQWWEKLLSHTASPPLTFTIVGHASGSYSLASVNRRIVRCLDDHTDGRVQLLPVENNVRGQITEVDEAEREYLLDISKRKPKSNHLNVAIVQHYPLYVPDGHFALKLLMIFWEESLMPESYVDMINSNFDGVLAPTRAVRKILIDSGVAIPAYVVNFPADLSGFTETANLRRYTASATPNDDVTFLHVSSCFPRKGVEVLLSAYAEAFRAEHSVRLVIKGFPNPHNDVGEQIDRLHECDPHAPAITFINEDIDPASMLRLYKQADAVVLPTRGEGLNLPAAEAIAAGLPLIVTGFGGHLDFCDGRSARLIDYSFCPARTHLSRQNSVWAEPDQKDLAAALRETYERILARRPEKVIEHNWPLVARYFDGADWAKRLEHLSLRLLSLTPRKNARVAWVSTFGIRCGIAEYSSNLLKELKSHNDDIVVLCDFRTDLVTVDTDFNVIPAWTPGDPASIENLTREIAAANAELVIIQHQPGLIWWTALVKLVNDHRVRNRKVLITLHNVQDLIELAPDVLSDVQFAFSKLERIFVHTVYDLNLLKSIGLIDNVTLFPHGVQIVKSSHSTGAEQGSQIEPLIGCYGFFVPHKGIATLIESLLILKQMWPRSKLRLVNAEYSLPLSAAEIERCRKLADDLGVKDDIEWITDFLPHARSMELLSECDLIVLPYQETNEASSAAARAAVSSGRVVAVTPIRIFDDLGSAVYRLPGRDRRSITDGISTLLKNPELQRSTLLSATAWLAAHDWKVLAKRLHGILLGTINSSPD